MKVLVACEFSATVREAFTRRGHEAWSCDLLDTEIPGQHIKGDVLNVINDGWDLMIAHPPCQYLCSSGMHRTTRGLRPQSLTNDAIKFVQKLMNAHIYRIGLENSVGVISTRIRKPDQYIQPYQFGHDASKKTCLWLKNLPLLQATKFIEPRKVCSEGKIKYRWSNQSDSGQNNLSPSPERWKNRSRTYQGIADAMADQWGLAVTV